MTKRVVVIAEYPGDADAVFAEALNFSELANAMQGLAHYEGLDVETAAAGETYVVDVTFFGCLKSGGHKMFVEKIDHAERVLQSRETNEAVQRWDYEISIQPDGDRVRWTDTVDIEAGWRTPFVAQFARYIYRYRHRNRKALSIRTSVENAA